MIMWTVDVPMRVNAVEHSLISVYVILKVLSKVGKLGLKRDNNKC